MRPFDDEDKKRLKKPKHAPNRGGMRTVNQSSHSINDLGDDEDYDYDLEVEQAEFERRIQSD